MSTKKANYTEAQENSIIEAASSNSVTDYASLKIAMANLAPSLGKSEKQLMGKVSFMSRSGITVPTDKEYKREGEPLYISKVYAPKTGGTVIRKADILTDICDKLVSLGSLPSGNAEVMQSVEGSTRPALLVILDALNKIQAKV